MATYTLHAPFEISARLMPAIRIDGATLSLDYGRTDRAGRIHWDCWIDLPDGSEHEITDLRSGCQGGNLQGGFGALLGFLSAAAESYSYRQRTGRTGENEDLFSPAIVAWADSCSDEISMRACEVDEAEDNTLIEEG